MQIQKSIKRLKRLRSRYLSSKTAVLYILNRKFAGLGKESGGVGKLTDIILDRERKNISLFVENHGNTNSIAMQGYGFTQKGGSPFLVWKTIQCQGPDRKNLDQVFNRLDGIELSKTVLPLVETIL